MIHKNKNYNIYIDPEDTHFLIEKTWHISSSKGKYYLVHNYFEKGKYKTIRFHRMIMGVTKTKDQVDHINGNGLDNRKENLRICTQAENNYNKKPLKTQKYKGITLKPYGKWEAQIAKDGKKYFLGRYITMEEAALAYNNKAKELFGNFAYLNKL